MIKESFWQNKKVFLTGATGFKGSWLSLWLSELGAEVMGYSLEPATEPSLFKIARVDEKINHFVGDICDVNKLKQTMVSVNPDIVIHMAAQALVRDSYDEPLLTYQTNVIGTANVLESVRSCPTVKAVLVITTDKCYENKEWCWGYRENESLGGYDPYSSSKACAEIVTAAYRRSFFQRAGIAVATARAGNVIGGGDWAKDRLIPDCLKAIENNEKIIIRSPHAIRPWQHVLEPLNGYIMLAEKLYLEGENWAEAWNFGPKESSCISVKSMVEKICVFMGGNYEIQKNSEYHEATYLKLDSSKANNRLQWQTKLTIEEAVEWISKWHIDYMKGQDMQMITIQQIQKYINI